MITALTITGIVLGYWLLGAVYARTQVARIYKKVVAENKHWSSPSYRDYWIKQGMLGGLVPRVCFWPIAMIVDLLAGPGARWFMRPVTERQERAEKLRADAKTWDEVVTHPSSTEQEREMARELAKMLRDQAKEAEL